MDHFDEDYRSLPKDDFRGRRAYLADHLFARSDGPSPPPTDLVPEDSWSSIMNLPTDVLLRTTDYQGGLVDAARVQLHAWVFALPVDEEEAVFVESASLDAYDEFQAALFIAMHGWYRQAASCLRTALEAMTAAASYGASGDKAGFESWRKGERSSKFRTQLRSVRRREQRPGLYDYDTGALGTLYQDLSDFAHGRPGNSSGDLWESNGPIWVPEALARFTSLLFDTMASSYLLMRVAWPTFELPGDARILFDPRRPRWAELGAGWLAHYFGT